ncbi:uncharacterized protein LOC120663647 [Panicum virgatum]|uniref:uncharacterized protein LOC120663647 n=1 Tax=Panicum virgatum TaxID=38727 RepID=UPI0019D5AC3B|nr:uncharacterized protein LOC120663647 [Panicum virgatum]
MDDICRFVASKAPQQMPSEKKRMISEAVSKVLSGVTDLLGGFIQDIAAAEYAPEPILRRSKRRRGTNNRQTADDDEDSDGPDPDYAEDTEEQNSSTKDDGSDPEDDNNSDPEDDGSDPELENKEDGEDAEDPEDLVPLVTRLKRPQSSARKPDTGSAATCNDIIVNGNTTAVAAGHPDKVQDKLYNRRSRLRLPAKATATQQTSNKILDAGCSSKDINIANVSVQHGDNLMAEGSSYRETNTDHCAAKQAIKIMGAGSSSREGSATKKSSWDFPVPDCDIMKFIEEPTPPKQAEEARSADSVSAWSLDGYDEAVYDSWEAEAIRISNETKANKNQSQKSCGILQGSSDSKEAPGTLQGSSDRKEAPKINKSEVIVIEAATSQGEATLQETKKNYNATAEPGSGEKSITPAYAPPRMRDLKTAAVLQSPFVNIGKKMSVKCSKDVLRVYNAVCLCSGRSTRSKQRDAVIINYLFTYATWGHLADSAKPGGKLLNTIAEVGIYAMNGKKTRGATKRIMPLHISVSPFPPSHPCVSIFFISFCIASIF